MTMNDKLQESLAEILDKTVSGVSAGVEFLSEELPDVVNQLLIWKMSEAIVYGLIQLTFMVLVSICITKALKYMVKNNQLEGLKRNGTAEEVKQAETELAYIEPKVVIYFTLSGIGGLVSLFAVFGSFLSNLSTTIQIWVAPKIYLIEYAANLYKSTGQ